ncbi:MAG TPA: hypothetical protein VMQ93_13185, partial [Novosphingobium sp.]|nr:hypothetical protein [Novosphingobium sp.]
MSEEPEDVAPEDTDISHVEGDAVLNLLVHLAEKGAGAGVTVYSQGLTFTGTLISRKGYLEKNLRRCQDHVPALAVLFEELLKHVDPVDDDAPAPDYNYVHLDNAMTMTPGQNGMPTGGTTMRITRDKIIGWSL